MHKHTLGLYLEVNKCICVLGFNNDHPFCGQLIETMHMVVIYKLQKVIGILIDLTDSYPFIFTLLIPLLQNILCGGEKKTHYKSVIKTRVSINTTSIPKGSHLIFLEKPISLLKTRYFCRECFPNKVSSQGLLKR